MEFFGFKTLEDLCNALQISTENCSCNTLHITTKDGNNLEFWDVPPPTTRYGALSLASLMFITSIMGLVGNVLVMCVQVNRAKKYSQLITSLAICDLLFAVLTFVYAVTTFWTSEWVYGLIGCKIVCNAMSLGAFIAIGVIQIIAIERFTGLVYPFSKGLARRYQWLRW